MLRRTAAVLALVTVLSPVVGRANEWEEEYPDDWSDQGPPADDYSVSVDMGVSGGVSIDTFQGPLAPYGDWVVVGSYGRVWRPHVDSGWRPYYYGRWEWTHEGWLWVSDEPFGWAAYHYGRWAYDPYQGWLWVPGSQWAPAWVSWRYSGDVVGWAPLAPGVSVYVGVTPFVDTWWTFVPCRSFVAVPVHTVAYAPRYTRRYFDASMPAPARRDMRPAPGRPVVSPAWGGPPPRAIEQRIGRPVTPLRVVAAPAPGVSRIGAGEVSIFRPEPRSGGRGPGRPTNLPSPSAERRQTSPGPAATDRLDGRSSPRIIREQPPQGGAPRERTPFSPGGGAVTPRSEPRPDARGGGSATFFRREPQAPAAPGGHAEPAPSALDRLRGGAQATPRSGEMGGGQAAPRSGEVGGRSEGGAQREAIRPGAHGEGSRGDGGRGGRERIR
jgi:hypothetical protein